MCNIVPHNIYCKNPKQQSEDVPIDTGSARYPYIDAVLIVEHKRHPGHFVVVLCIFLYFSQM